VSTPLAASHRGTIGLAVALVLVALTVVALGTTGGLYSLLGTRIAGHAAPVIEDVPGPETGPECPLDARYVNEEPIGLRPDVLAAWRRLRTDAERADVRLCLNDGKRSATQQQREFDAAVEKFGTPELAAQYVLPPEKSMHVKGIAVDVQPLSSAGWVEDNGAALGWCRRYENEPWHFEYVQRYVSAGCPDLLPSANES
jgi:zinc D-Ala-D-Ala carboxypeptidase